MKRGRKAKGGSKAAPALTRVEQLLESLRSHCEPRRGSKAALARHLGVRPHMVSEWLAGTQPSAENALGIQEWLAQQSAA